MNRDPQRPRRFVAGGLFLLALAVGFFLLLFVGPRDGDVGIYMRRMYPAGTDYRLSCRGWGLVRRCNVHVEGATLALSCHPVAGCAEARSMPVPSSSPARSP